MDDGWRNTVRGAGLGGAAAALLGLLIAHALRCFDACAPTPTASEILTYVTLAGTASGFLLAWATYGRGAASSVLFAVAGLLSGIVLVTSGLFILVLGVLLGMLGVITTWPLASPGRAITAATAGAEEAP